MSITRKDLNTFASCVSLMNLDADSRREVARPLAAVFVQYNPHIDRYRFIRACIPESEKTIDEHQK